MNAPEHTAAMTLGWNQALWDGGASTVACGIRWEELPPAQQQAGQCLGYDAPSYVHASSLFVFASLTTMGR